VVPPDADNWTLVLLHGRSSGPSSFLSRPFFDALHSLGRRAPVVLLLDGGDHSYWHNRADGDWGSMVLDEAIPEHRRVAIGGISMGGYGALLLGAREISAPSADTRPPFGSAAPTRPPGPSTTPRTSPATT
jgi:pimeloyl-ACP methyl ester carboxylesterase